LSSPIVFFCLLPFIICTYINPYCWELAILYHLLLQVNAMDQSNRKENEEDDAKINHYSMRQLMALHGDDDDDDDDDGEAEEQSTLNAFRPSLNTRGNNLVDTERGLYRPQINNPSNYTPPGYRAPSSIYYGESYALSDSDSDESDEDDGVTKWADLPPRHHRELNDESDEDGELASFMRRHNLIGTNRVPAMTPVRGNVFGPATRDGLPLSNLRFDGAGLVETQEEADVKRAIAMSLEQFKLEKEKQEAEKLREEIQKNYAQELLRMKAETEVSDDSGDDNADYAFYCDEDGGGEGEVDDGGEGEVDTNSNGDGEVDDKNNDSE